MTSVKKAAPSSCKAAWNALDRENEIAEPAMSMEIGTKAMSDLIRVFTTRFYAAFCEGIVGWRRLSDLAAIWRKKPCSLYRTP